MKKKLYINACRLFSLLAIVTLFVACDAHRDFPDTAMKPCHILCTDGKVLSVSVHTNQTYDHIRSMYMVRMQMFSTYDHNWDIFQSILPGSIGL